MKKFIPLLSLISIAVVSTACSVQDKRVKLAMNIDTFLADKENEYQTPDIEKISANIEINASFAVYFTNEGCSDCINFKPIMDEFILEHNYMVYKFDYDADYESIISLKEKYGDKFFASSESPLTLPALAIVNEGNVEYVNSESYMKTKNAFFNYMNSHYIESNVYYTSGNVFDREFNNKEFAYVYFDYQNESLMNLYKTKLDQPVKTSKRKVIVSNYKEDDYIHLKLSGRTNLGTYSRLEFFVTEETSPETISLVL